jgi:ABC-type branched-subunit amino acid transport system substrate-binding protein
MPDLASLPGRVFAAAPFLAADVTPEGEAEYQRFAASAKLPSTGFASQFTTIAEARILIEGLKRAGRDLSRERLVQSLEAIYDFPAGYRQLVSFGPNRRVGIPEVHIVAIDKTGAFREVTRP